MLLFADVSPWVKCWSVAADLQYIVTCYYLGYLNGNYSLVAVCTSGWREVLGGYNVLPMNITCDQAYFFWERRREKGEGKKLHLIHLLNEMPTTP